MFVDPSSLSFPKFFENNFNNILNEYKNVEEYLIKYNEKNLHTGGWETVGLYAWPIVRPVHHIIKLCPVLNNLVLDYIPKHGTVSFNRLKPKTVILPHTGIKSNFLRYHLGLIVPEGECYISVAGEKKYWQTNKSLVFNDQLIHHVVNSTNQERVILLIDFEI